MGHHQHVEPHMERRKEQNMGRYRCNGYLRYENRRLRNSPG
jgi:hypothetical protein